MFGWMCRANLLVCASGKSGVGYPSQCYEVRTSSAVDNKSPFLTKYRTKCTGERFEVGTSVKSVKISFEKNLLFYLLLFGLFLSLATPASASLGAHLVCAGVPGLTDKQRAMCRASPVSIAAVGDGLRMAYSECRVQFAGSRWNCSGVGEGNIFGHIMPLATKEAAFTYAITSAGVTHALSSACARGDLPGCRCRPNNRRRSMSSEQFQWGGCGDSYTLAYGVRFARRFLDAKELESDARSLMNLHNNRAGRKMVKDLVRRECKCHGVSGSCALKTCWMALPTFRAVAQALKEKYAKSKKVVQHPPPSAHAPSSHLAVLRTKTGIIGRQPRKSELVFLESSPSYCEADVTNGILGTFGRHCNRTSRATDGNCETLCCGRGYNTVRTVNKSQCNCQFHWCCNVTCETCITKVELHICK